ncbi:MAG TPA: diguanylate cyclase [Rhodocyclaceae bacterium]
MRIATRLRLISTATIAAVVLLTPVLVAAVLDFKRAKADYALAEKIHDNFLERAAFRDQYFLYREDRMRQQWDKSKEASDVLLRQARQELAGEQEQQILERLGRTIDESVVVFHRIVDNTAALQAANGNRQVYAELDKRLYSQMLLKAMTIRDATTTLQSAGAQRVEDAYRHLLAAIGWFAGALALATVLTAIKIGALIRQRLVPLHLGAQKIAQGELEYRIPPGPDDEFADLARSFNDTADKLTAEIGAHRQAEEMLHKLSIAVEQSPAAVVITDLDAHIEYVNPQFTEDTGYSAGEILGKNPRILQSGQTSREVYTQLWEALTNGRNWHGELLNKRKSGELFWEEARIAPVKDSSGVVTHYVAVVADATLRKQMEEQVRQLAFYDTLTKLPNRRLLHDRLDITLAASKRRSCFGALMFIDLDSFKPLNDTYGHAVGDLLLVEAAMRLKSCVREMDTVARFGGDEFVVLINELHGDRIEASTQASMVAEKVRAVLSEPYSLPVRTEGTAPTRIEYSCTASIGVTLFIDHQTTQDDILKWADAAMYEAKEAGRNQIRFHTAES